MISIYKIIELGYDFMGYIVEDPKNLTLHHLIIPRKYSEELGCNSGYFLWNCVILGLNPHAYLHVIEKLDAEIFFLITRILADENAKGRIDIENLKKIRKLLEYFEVHYSNAKNKKGELYIKPCYVEKRVHLP